MEEQLISLETAKLSKEKGFNNICNKYWVETLEHELDIPRDGIEKFPAHEPRILNHKPSGNFHIIHGEAPTQSLLQKWLRENHKIHIEIDYLPLSEVWASDVCFYLEQDSFLSTDGYVGDSYEKVLEKALYESLKLISNE